MKRFHIAALSLSLAAVVGCNKEGSSTAPGTGAGTGSGDHKKDRKLTVTSPGSQSVSQDKTDEFTVSISRSHFTGPITIDFQGLPKGVALETKDMVIPEGKDSAKFLIKAAGDAAPVDEAVVKVVAKAADMPAAETDFKLTVKAKAGAKLEVKSPGHQSLTQDKTDEMKVSVTRDNINGAVAIEVTDLPKGVTVDTKEMSIPEGKDSLAVTLKAAPDAPPVEDHVVKITAKGKDVKEAVTDFKLTVKKK